MTVATPVITHLEDNVDQVEIGDKTIILVGTAHISHQSVELARRVIREQRPDTVAVELCAPRFESLKNPDKWKNTDIFQILKQGKGFVLLAQLILSAFQKRLGEKFGIKPGAEMLAAVEECEALGAQLLLADRLVSTTLRRTWSSMGFWSLLKLLWSALLASAKNEQVTEAEIERLKSADALEEAMREFSEAMPEVRTALIDERDLYLTAKIRESGGKRIVAVLGAGHVPGMLKSFATEIDIASLDEVPPRSILMRLFIWGIPVAMIAMVAYGFWDGGIYKSASMATSYALVTAAFATVGALITLAHPLAILATAISAPVMTIRPGWVTGLTEAWLRRPRVSDFEAVTADLSSFRGFWRNRITRILIITAVTNVAGLIGTFVAFKVMAGQLSSPF